MNLQQRVELMVGLGDYILSDDNNWQAAKEKAFRENGWFTPEFIELACRNLAAGFLEKEKLQQWCAEYRVPDQQQAPKNIGIVMAGNIPLVGFHDFLCAFMAGHRQTIKPSSKDETLIRHIVGWLNEQAPETSSMISFSSMLKGCDAYIATGSNNSARYFDYYFGKYLNIIRRNRTSVAVLDGKESIAHLEKLADDVHQYFGLGCRNITKIYVPAGYDFVPLLETFRKYGYLADHHKYKNNYDYQLALLILNKQFYMTNGSILLHEDPSLFSPISQLNVEYYTDPSKVQSALQQNNDVQCIAGNGYLAFGQTQQPALTDYADGVDTLQFLLKL